MDLLTVNNLVCGYDDKEVIRDISFSIAGGSFTGIIGPNGAGKSTLFKALTKIVRPTEGAVLYRGNNIAGMEPAELAREIAVLPQILEIPFSFTVEELVLMGRFPHLRRMEKPGERDREIVENALVQTGLEPLRSRHINQLSGGERQRVLFAQALVQEPSLLLLDEPVSFLDIRHQVELLDLLKKLNRKNLTVLAILHDLNLASEYCDRIIILDEGQIHSAGTPDEVLTYQAIEQVYKTVVVVKENPITHKPHVIVVPAEAKNSATARLGD